MNFPLVSVVLPTKNSMPHLKKAIQGLKQQTYKNFELIIQDGGSTDGTLEYVHNICGIEKITIVSEPDSGIGQAYNRGIARSNADLLCLTASDECLFDYSLEMAVSWFKEYPTAASVYGGVIIIDQNEREMQRFIPKPFDVLKFMACQLFPTTGGLLNRKVIGKDLFYDESLKTCPDYDFWLRLGRRFSANGIINRQEFFMTTLGDRTSMTYRPESYEQFCKDKLFILDRFLVNPETSSDLKASEETAKLGILRWAYSSVLQMEDAAQPIKKFYEEIAKLEQVPSQLVQPVGAIVKVSILRTYFRRTFRLGLKKIPVHIKGGKALWGYAAQADFDPTFFASKQYKYWVKIRIKVSKGLMGICMMNEEEIEREKIFHSLQGEVETYFPIDHPANSSLKFRNGGKPKSEMDIYELSILKEPIGKLWE